MKIQNLPRAVAVKFVENCRAYWDAGHYEKQREIAFDQLERFRQYDPNFRIWDVVKLFEQAPAALGMARRSRRTQ